MDYINYLGILCVALYIINDSLRNKALFKEKRFIILAMLDGVFLIGVVSVLLTNYIDLLNYWWLLIILGLPSLYYQFLRIKKSDGLNSIKFIKLGITIILIILVWLKV